MKCLQACQFQIEPDSEKIRTMRRFTGSCRFLFHKKLALQQESPQNGEKQVGYAGLCPTLTVWRNSLKTSWPPDALVYPRKTQFSRGWKKTEARTTKLHQKIGPIRRDYVHKTTAYLLSMDWSC